MPVLAFFAAYFAVRLVLRLVRALAYGAGYAVGYVSETGRYRPIKAVGITLLVLFIVSHW